MEKKIFFAVQIILVVIACVYVGQEMWKITHNTQWQWDFRTYYYATATASADENPYDTSTVYRTTGHHIRWAFLYPPTTLYLLQPLSAFTYQTSYFLFLGLKLVVLTALIVLWVRLFPKETGGGNRLIFIISLCLGYSHVLLWDIQVGNISIFEQFFLWLGIYLLLRREWFAGYGSIAIGSLLKIVPGLFLLLPLLLKWSVKNVVLFMITCLLFGAVLIAPYWTDPVLFGQFTSDVHIDDERGRHNPSSLAFFKDAGEMTGLPEVGVYILYGFFVLLVLLSLYPAIRKLKQHRMIPPAEKQLALISLFVIAYTLVLPRMKDYSFIVMMMPALFIIRVAFQHLRFRVVAYGLFWIPLGWYHPFFFTVFLLVSLLVWIFRARDGMNRDINSTLPEGEPVLV